MLSVYRDTYLNIGDDNYTKVNAAYASGGPEQALSTLNRNLDLNIEDYVTVGFAGLADAIDELGGITIDVDSDEIEYINAYQKTMTKQLNKEYKEVTQSGSQTLNGIQSVSYCRIRYTSGSDYKRTQRQRTVLSQMLAKAKKSSPFKLKRAMEAALQGVQTSLNTSQILSLLPIALKCKITDSDGMPFEQYRTTARLGNKGDCVIPKTLADNVTELHKFLYDTEDYQPSAMVNSYSEAIRSIIN
jgi:LCP family protein required for cell wall assembly